MQEANGACAKAKAKKQEMLAKARVNSLDPCPDLHSKALKGVAGFCIFHAYFAMTVVEKCCQNTDRYRAQERCSAGMK